MVAAVRPGFLGPVRGVEVPERGKGEEATLDVIHQFSNSPAFCQLLEIFIENSAALDKDLTLEQFCEYIENNEKNEIETLKQILEQRQSLARVSLSYILRECASKRFPELIVLAKVFFASSTGDASLIFRSLTELVESHLGSVVDRKFFRHLQQFIHTLHEFNSIKPLPAFLKEYLLRQVREAESELQGHYRSYVKNLDRNKMQSASILKALYIMFAFGPKGAKAEEDYIDAARHLLSINILNLRGLDFFRFFHPHPELVEERANVAFSDRVNESKAALEEMEHRRSHESTEFVEQKDTEVEFVKFTVQEELRDFVTQVITKAQRWRPEFPASKHGAAVDKEKCEASSAKIEKHTLKALELTAKESYFCLSNFFKDGKLVVDSSELFKAREAYRELAQQYEELLKAVRSSYKIYFGDKIDHSESDVTIAILKKDQQQLGAKTFWQHQTFLMGILLGVKAYERHLKNLVSNYLSHLERDEPQGRNLREVLDKGALEEQAVLEDVAIEPLTLVVTRPEPGDLLDGVEHLVRVTASLELEAKSGSLSRLYEVLLSLEGDLRGLKRHKDTHEALVERKIKEVSSHTFLAFQQLFVMKERYQLDRFRQRGGFTSLYQFMIDAFVAIESVLSLHGYLESGINLKTHDLKELCGLANIEMGEGCRSFLHSSSSGILAVRYPFHGYKVAPFVGEIYSQPTMAAREQIVRGFTVLKYLVEIVFAAKRGRVDKNKTIRTELIEKIQEAKAQLPKDQYSLMALRKEDVFSQIEEMSHQLNSIRDVPQKHKSAAQQIYLYARLLREGRDFIDNAPQEPSLEFLVLRYKTLTEKMYEEILLLLCSLQGTFVEHVHNLRELMDALHVEMMVPGFREVRPYLESVNLGNNTHYLHTGSFTVLRESYWYSLFYQLKKEGFQGIDPRSSLPRPGSMDFFHSSFQRLSDFLPTLLNYAIFRLSEFSRLREFVRS